MVEINWTDYELPNGLQWHVDRLRDTIDTMGKAYGCFHENVLVGYATVNSDKFGSPSKNVLLEQLFVSKNYRNMGIGRKLFYLCATQGKKWGADRLYICAGSSEDTIAFYNKLGCVDASEINQVLYDEDPNDMQLEYSL